MRARGDLFGPDHGLVLRMAATALLTPLLVAAALAAVLWFLSTQLVLVVAGALITGIFLTIRERRAAAVGGLPLRPCDAPEVHASVERLCIVADLPKPKIVLEYEEQPNSWIEGTARGGYRLHLTQGLLALLSARELEAVIAHELAHVAHRDAAVMTAVGGPGEALLAGGLRVASQGWWPLSAGGGLAAAIGWCGSLGTRALSRYREFAADEGAVKMTGSPAALAAALTKVSEGLIAIPKRDLREAAVRDAFHLLPAARESRYGLPPTHPPLRDRIERLERLERTLQRG